jgi:hypothetical protein
MAVAIVTGAGGGSVAASHANLRSARRGLVNDYGGDMQGVGRVPRGPRQAAARFVPAAVRPWPMQLP